MAVEMMQASQRKLEQIRAFRDRGMSWFDILNAINVTPSYFYPLVDVCAFGPPYSLAYDCYVSAGGPDSRWSDDDLRRLAEVKAFVSRANRPLPDVIRVFRSHPTVVYHDTTYVYPSPYQLAAPPPHGNSSAHWKDHGGKDKEKHNEGKRNHGHEKHGHGYQGKHGKGHHD